MGIGKKVRIIKTDVLILGGGSSGINAALGAKEKDINVDVLVVEKAGNVERSGDTGAGVDHMMGIMEEGEYWDTPEGVLKNLPEITDSMTPMEPARTFCAENKQRILALEKLGYPFLHDSKTGKYIRTPGFGLTGTHWINFEGYDFKKIIAREARRLGVEFIERIMVTNLLTQKGRVVGAVGFHIRSGAFFVFQAKAVIITLGDIVRYGSSPSGYPFDTWHCPANTGDGQAMAYRMGAELSNMEFGITTPIPMAFAAAGMNAFFGMGGRLINAKGEQFMKRYHPRGDKANRFILMKAIFHEMLEGRGPCYMDVTHLSRKDIKHLIKLLAADKPTFPEWFAQKGLDLTKEPLEVTISPMNSVGAVGPGNGIVIDKDCKTSLDGLYASGNCSWFMFSTSGASVMGYHAGKHAALYCKKEEMLVPDTKQIEDEREDIFAPIKQKQADAITPKVFEDKIRQIMFNYVGYARNARGLQTGIQKLEELRTWFTDIKAENFHELMRANEAKNLLEVSALMARAALERKETRLGLYHYRTDYPERDDVNWKKFLILKKKYNKIHISTKPA